MNNKEKFLWLFSLGVAGTGIYLLYSSINNKLTAAIKQNRQIAACRANACALLSGSVVKFDVPLFNLAFYTGAAISQVTSRLNAIKTQYGALIASVAQLTNLPEMLLRGFVFIESNGNPSAIGGNSIGLMQIDPVTAHGMIYLENKQGRLTMAEKVVLQKYLGTRLNLIFKDKWMNQSQHVTANDLKNPEFNLLVGAIYLGILVDEHTEGEVLRLDKIVSRYNRGYFRKVSGTLSEVYNSQPAITKEYILKLAGKNGVLDIMSV